MIGVGAVLGQREAVRLLDVDLDARAGLQPIGEEGRGDAQPPAAGNVVAHRIDGQMQLARRRQRRGGDGVEARLQRLQAFHERLRDRDAPARTSPAPPARRAWRRRRPGPRPWPAPWPSAAARRPPDSSSARTACRARGPARSPRSAHRGWACRRPGNRGGTRRAASTASASAGSFLGIEAEAVARRVARARCRRCRTRRGACPSPSPCR